MRILHIVPESDVASATRHARQDIENISQAGIITDTFFLKSRTRPFILVREWFRFKRVLRSFRPDIVHAQYGTVTAVFCIAATTTPLVVTFRGSELNPTPDISALREKTGHVLSQIAALRARKIVCVSEKLKNRLWWRHERVVVIPSSVNPQRFLPQPREAARELLGWDTNESVVVFNKGRIPKTKGLDLALAAVDMARVIYGPIRMEVFDGYIYPDRIPTYLSAADCLLCTSVSEGAPTIVKEAMACNLPVVSVDVGDVAESLAGVENCLICKHDSQELAKALVSVLRSGRRSDGRLHITDFTDYVCRDRRLETYNLLLQESRMR